MPTSIEYCDEMWPVVTGCTPVSEGCKNCWAARLAATRLKHHRWYKGLAVMRAPGMPRWTGEVRLNHDVLEKPLHWRKPRRVFVASTGDLFHESVPFEFVERVFHVISQCPQHTFIVLTKRAWRMYDWCLGEEDRQHNRFDILFPNVIGMVTAENQARADERIPWLLKSPFALRGVSIEPMLGPVNLAPYLLRCEWCEEHRDTNDSSCSVHSEKCYRRPWSEKLLNWVIVGGESGPGAWPMHPDWPRDVRDECEAAGVPFFFKQWGAWKPGGGTEDPGYYIPPQPSKNMRIWSDARISYRVGKNAAGRLLDGQEHNEFPQKLKDPKGYSGGVEAMLEEETSVELANESDTGS